MTSKEILEQIKHCGNRDWRLAIEDIEKDINEIMDYIKDLKEENRKQKEILDIMKNAIIECDLFIFCDDFYDNKHHHYIENLDNCKSMYLTEEEYIKIKEWLDNDK